MKRCLLAFLAVAEIFFLAGCATGGGGATVTINGVETVSNEPLEPIKWAQKGQQLSFCVKKGVISNDFQSRNNSVKDTNYYLMHRADFLRGDTPFESIEAIGDSLEETDCDILIVPRTIVYVMPFPLDTVKVHMTVSVTAVKMAGINMSADVTEAPSVEAAASRLGRIVYNAFAPGTPLYAQVASLKAQAAKSFEAEAARYRSLTVKPALPEEARKYMVQAEAAVKRQSFGDAVDRYRDALKIAPWWPEGHFNRALLLGEIGRYKEAIASMKKYLMLVPGAADAQGAQDKIYEWEGLADKAGR